MTLSTLILETLIQNQKDAINRYRLYSLSVIVIGASIILGSNLFISNNSTETVKIILNIGGGCVSTICAFPINQIILRREKLKIYQTFKTNFARMNLEEMKKFENLIWESIQTT